MWIVSVTLDVGAAGLSAPVPDDGSFDGGAVAAGAPLVALLAVDGLRLSATAAAPLEEPLPPPIAVLLVVPCDAALTVAPSDVPLSPDSTLCALTFSPLIAACVCWPFCSALANVGSMRTAS